MYFWLIKIPETNVPKLLHVLSNRYQDRSGGYVRILRNGFRKSGSDRAPLAIVELVNNPNDITYHFAKKQLDQTTKQLQDIESEKYIRKPIILRNLKTGANQEVVKLKDKANITGTNKKKYSRIELALHKKILKYNKSMDSYPIARQRDQESEVKVREMITTGTDIKKGYYLPPADKVEAALAVPVRRKAPRFTQAAETAVLGTSADSPTEKKGDAISETAPSKEAIKAPKSFAEKYFGSWFKSK